MRSWSNEGSLPLPAGATTATSGLIDLANSPNGDFSVDRVKWQLQVPALTAAQLPAGDTIAYSIFSSPNADGSNPRVLVVVPPITTGANGSGGSVAANYDFGLPMTVDRYLGVTATGGQAGVAASGATAQLAILF